MTEKFYYVFKIGNNGEDFDATRFQDSDKTYEELRQFVVEHATMNKTIFFDLSDKERDNIGVSFLAGAFKDEESADLFCQGYCTAMEDFVPNMCGHYDVLIVETTKSIQ